MTHDMIDKILQGKKPTPADALELLQVQLGDPHYHRILALADEYARSAFGGRGQVFAQIGLDAQPCPVNCRFCSLACDSLAACDSSIKTDAEITLLAQQLVAAGVQELFLMTTAAYDPGEYLRVGRLVRGLLPTGMRMVANVGDFNHSYALALKAAGFTGAYHICRLGEGVDTQVSVAQRMDTLHAIRAAGLELYYCVEPIGPEHTNQQLVEEIFRTADLDVGVMAVMRRIAVPTSPLYHRGEIPAHRLALICAVTLLCTHPARAMGVHEPEELSLLAGANQIYAETGVNPRDTNFNTQEGRGFSVARAQKMLTETGWMLWS